MYVPIMEGGNMINRNELKELLDGVLQRLKGEPEVAGKPCKKDVCADDPCATCMPVDFCADDPCAWPCKKFDDCLDACADDPCGGGV